MFAEADCVRKPPRDWGTTLTDTRRRRIALLYSAWTAWAGRSGMFREHGVAMSAAAERNLLASGVSTIEQLTALNEREVLMFPGVGPSALATIIDGLAATGQSLAADPFAAYECARHSDAARDAELREYFLCDPCRREYSTLAFSEREPEWVSGERIDGYCGHCNGLTVVRLTQWFLCGTCDRVIRSIGRGLASARFVETEWAEVFGTASALNLIETDPVLLQPRGRRSDPSRTTSADFVASEATGEPVLGLELKSGRSALPGSGVGNPMAQFQLDTTDCDDISAAAGDLNAPVFLLHAQVIGRAHAPTERYVGVGLWYARPWDLLPNLIEVRRRPRETRDAAYFKTTAFHPFDDFSRYMDEDFESDLVALDERGWPLLYEN